MGLLDFDAVNSREETEHGSPQARQDVALAHIACDATLDPRDGHDVTVLVELLEQLVAEDDLEDAAHELEKWHVTVDETGRHRHVGERDKAAHALTEQVGEDLLEDEEGQSVDEGGGASVPVIRGAPGEDGRSLILSQQIKLVNLN